MTTSARFERLKTLIANIRETLGVSLVFRLWDGTTIPADAAPDALTIAIADEGVISALFRKPKIDTLLNLYVTRRLDLLNGTLFELVAERPKIRSRDVRRALDKKLVLRSLADFMFRSRGGPWPLEAIKGHKAQRDGSETANKENVHYHYDVSNAFYALFLDPEMVYTCAYFRDWDNDIATAQRDKLDMICRKLRLQPGETLLDIGSGWGALVCHAAQHYGVNAVGVTLADEQYVFAREKVTRLGLQDRIRFELRDYTQVQGQFDKIASIGMFEQVGIPNYPTYFQTVHRLLKPGGLYLHHAIARPAKKTDKAFRRTNPEYAAIRRYIFPGGELDHLGMSVANLERYGFEVHDVEGWREHYQMTLRHWHDRLFARYDEAVAEVGEVKTRLWLAYIAGCSIAFQRNSVTINQTLASRRQRGPSGLPPTRADLYIG
ncbi:cyclopropane-fatty-acyl-phospholipid synthase family protein [Mesorhizobium sp. BR1-1-16]|uniref:SAM-dependent methyltransferase n=1 Tax=Mesorhizobium sp. BR1-1-16 TaxID=2876653 RepID=UPI001CCD0F4E|nr:cyclopropane-fatty-acyl-phospholipid synthase family protein [Mesorhizobium sp. BR1-1-16]MBZ9937453.1 cyclopropane-fatty-acyl-phospholipid synthase family protein [Mesorhizobium sp. BR1-1-16]